MNTTEKKPLVVSTAKEALNPNTKVDRLVELAKSHPHFVFQNPVTALELLANSELHGKLAVSMFYHLEEKIPCYFPLGNTSPLVGQEERKEFFSAYIDGLLTVVTEMLTNPVLVEEISGSGVMNGLETLRTVLKSVEKPGPEARTTKTLYKDLFGRKPKNDYLEFTAAAAEGWNTQNLGVCLETFDFEKEVSKVWERINLYGSRRSQKTSSMLLKTHSPAWWDYLRWEVFSRVDHWGRSGKEVTKVCHKDAREFLLLVLFRNILPPMYDDVVGWLTVYLQGPYVEKDAY